MKLRRFLLGTAAVVIGLPLTLGLGAVVVLQFLDRSNGELEVAGETREYLLYVPSSYDPERPTPLVVSLHAAATWPGHQKNVSRWNELADEHGFLVVYPAGHAQVLGVVRIWEATPERVGAEIDFVAALIDRLRSSYNVDPARIYANGFSNGGGMTFAVSCALADRVAAVGTVAAAYTLSWEWCGDARPMPVISFHGTADKLVPYEGGLFGDPFNPVKPEFPPVPEWMARWAERNGCQGNAERTRIAPDVVRVDYAGCNGAPVIHHVVEGAGHIWPGGEKLPEWRVGPYSDGVDATGEMWAFFERHRLPEAAAVATTGGPRRP